MDAATVTDENAPFDGHAWVGCRTYVTLVRERPHRARPYRVRGPADIHRAFRSLSTCDRERFYTVHLDAKHQVCGVELVSQGIVDASLITPREVYKSAILANASGLILLHNHPADLLIPAKRTGPSLESSKKAASSWASLCSITSSSATMPTSASLMRGCFRIRADPPSGRETFHFSA